MKHTGRDFSLKARVRSPGWTWAKAKIYFFSEYDHDAYQIKGNTVT